jgi:hypothetical protein
MIKYIQPYLIKKGVKISSMIDVETEMETEAKEKVLRLVKEEPGLITWQICAMTGLNWDTVCLSLGRLCHDCLVKCVPRSRTENGLRAEYFSV